MKNLEQQPMSENKKSYIDNEERMAALKAKPAEDLSMEEFKALKEAKQANEGLVDKAQDEAGVEDAERKAEKEGKIYDEAKAEDAAFEQKKAAESALQLAEDTRVKAAEDAEKAKIVLAGLQDTKTEMGSVGESAWKSKTWQEIRQSTEDAVTPEDRAKYKSEQLEAWHALKDLEGADAEKLEDARQNAEHQIKMKEETVSKPLASYDIRSGVSQSSWEERQERSRQEYIEDLEGWKKRLEAINEVMNKGESESVSAEEKAEFAVEDVDGLINMKQKTGESADEFNERKKNVAQEIAKKEGYKDTETIYAHISDIDYKFQEAAKKNDGTYSSLVSGELGKKREKLINLNAYAGKF